MESYFIDTAELQITQLEFVIRFLVACGIGLLIGLEREYASLAKQEKNFAGIRTFVMLTVLGFVGAAMNYLISPMAFGIILGGIIVLTGISYWIIATRGDVGGTSEITTILAVLLGGLTFLGYIEISLMITVIVLVVLSSKLKLHAFIGNISREEMYDFIRFVVVALLIFPFLPNKTYGPYDVLNPRDIGWVILLTSGVGFLGYILMRAFGAGKGILLTGILGGLVSSTMTTWIFSRKSKEHPALSPHCAVAILAASSIMIVRVCIWVLVFNRKLFPGLAVGLGMILAAACVVTLYYYFKNNNKAPVKTSIPPGEPLQLTNAMMFGGIYTLILFIVAYASANFGQAGIYVSSGIAGLTDVDAITISVSKLGWRTIDMASAQNAILIATISNTLVKIGIALWAGSKEMRPYMYVGYGFIFLVAMAAFGIMNLF